MFPRQVFAFVTAVLLLTAASVAVAANRYRLTAHLAQGGQRVPVPPVLLTEGVANEVQVARPGAQPLRLSFLAKPAGGDRVKIAAIVHLPKGVTARPVIIVAKREKATVRMDDLEMDLVVEAL